MSDRSACEHCGAGYSTWLACTEQLCGALIVRESEPSHFCPPLRDPVRARDGWPERDDIPSADPESCE
jgi:hypothetical protein